MKLSHLLLNSALISLSASAAFAKDDAKKADYVTREEMPEVIREVLVANPDIMTDVMNALRKAQAERAQKEMDEGLKKNQAVLFDETTYPSTGASAKDADVVLVEFFDYHCGYCKRALPTINELIKKDKKVRVVFRDLPILSEDSTVAARAALAVNKVEPKKYFEYHTKLMGMNGKFTEELLTKAAKEIGVDEKKFKAAFDDKALTEMLEATQELSMNLGVRGTPAFALRDAIIPGAVSLEEIEKKIAEQRSGKKEEKKD